VQQACDQEFGRVLESTSGALLTLLAKVLAALAFSQQSSNARGTTRFRAT
jgi:hypothetical protein